MHGHSTHSWITSLIPLLLGVLLACSPATENQEKAQSGEPQSNGKPSIGDRIAPLIEEVGPLSEDAQEKIIDLYDKARESGEQVPDDVADWVKQDIQKMGSWKYQVVTLTNPSDEELAKKLNTMGAERWECFDVEYMENETVRLHLKRPVRSYLKAIPIRELLRLVPLDTGGAAE